MTDNEDMNEMTGGKKRRVKGKGKGKKRRMRGGSSVADNAAPVN